MSIKTNCMKSVFKSVIFALLIALGFTSCQKDIVNGTTQAPPVAEAGNTQAIQLPAASFTLTGTGTSSNGAIVGYLWSLVSGPNVPVIISPSSASTAVTNFIAGTYRFQFMVIDQAGLTGVDTVSIFVTQAPIQTLTLQPANNVNEVHLGIWNGADYTNRQPLEIDGAAWTSGGTPLTTRGMLKFDLSSIPANATILTAKLTLYSNPTPLLGNFIDANFGTNNSLYLGRLTGNWDPATVTWQTQPAIDFATQISLPHTNLSFLDLVDIDVKSLVSPMVASNNYGFLFRLQTEVFYNIRVFCSSRYANASKHPKLVITYQ